MPEEKFSWIPFYRELAEVLLKYRNNRAELLELIYKNPVFASQTTYLRMQDGSLATDIDPLSFFGIFNRGIKREARKAILREQKTFFGLTSPLPDDFAGIPLLNNQKSFYFLWDSPEVSKFSCEELWEFFESVLSGNINGELFDKIVARKGIGIAMLTIAMFWIRPGEFLPLDKLTKNFLESEYGVSVEVNDFSSYASFIQFLEVKMQNREILEKSFAEISENAFQKNELPVINVLVSPERVYSCHLNISKAEWIQILSHKELGDGQCDTILKFYSEPNHRGSCKEVGEKYGVHSSSLIGFMTGFAKFAQRVLNRFRLRDNGGNNYFMIPCKEGKYIGKYFQWTLRDELVEAIEELGLSEKKENKVMEDYSQYVELLKHAKNLILTGAPGTGKSYLAKRIAEAMGAESAFVQFHPSFDYADFIEGLRPVKNENGNVSFERQDGIFKEFCRKALFAQTIRTADVFEGLNENPTIWKVSLKGTGENPIRTDCLENGWIRIGYDEYGNVENFDEFDGFSKGKSVLRTFQNVIKIGDIVLSCWSSKEIDAIGIVTGDYEYREDSGEYSRYRNVKWIVKNIRENIVELNGGKQMTLSAVYRLSMSIQDVQKIVEKYLALPLPAIKAKPFVFIIDEINRGEIAKIFGELFYSIEPGHRGEKERVKTQYQNLVPEGDVFKNGFYVPENVYVIGTMNDIDRSVECMDFAMRRRFCWQEITPTDRIEMFDAEIPQWKDEAIKHMNALNDAIKNTDSLNAAYQIGPAYFLNLEACGGDFGKLWENYLSGTLKEYLRGVPAAEEILQTLKGAYDSANAN